MELLITDRYCGPPRSANGGYVAGALAHALGAPPGEAATVTLRRPPPLDVPLALTTTVEGALEARDGEALVATALLGGEVPEPVEPVDVETARRASASYPGLRAHPFPTCFGCGTARNDGLRVFPGRVDDQDGSRVAAPWTPDQSVVADFHEYADPQPRACTAATWAALDCVGGWAGDFSEERPLVLGRMTAVLDELPAVGEPHVVLGQAVGAEGRKVFTTSTLVDADGRVVGRAAHTWVRVDPGLFS